MKPPREKMKELQKGTEKYSFQNKEKITKWTLSLKYLGSAGEKRLKLIMIQGDTWYNQ